MPNALAAKQRSETRTYRVLRFMRFNILLLVGCVCGVTAGAQAQPAPDPAFAPLDGWTADTHEGTVTALAVTCDWFGRRGLGREIRYEGRTGLTDDWTRICEAAAGLPDDDGEAIRTFLERWFEPVLIDGDEGRFTGYYETELRGSWEQTETYDVPIYRMPPKQEDGAGYPSRAQIAAGALEGQGLELLWVDDPVDAFFTEIEGSGVVLMEDGSSVGIEYGGQNGHGYYAIGRWLVETEEGTLDEMSMAFIRGWIDEHPDRAQELMNRNPSFVFFEQREDGDGAQGAIAATLTPLRSMAVDRRHIPLGVPLWLEIDDDSLPGGSIRRLVFAQDVGGAIRGRVRGDLFWGAGEEAAKNAGDMNAAGRYYMLVPREEPLAAVPPVVPLPAGLYFRQAGYSTCDGCATPEVAAVMGIVATAEQARTLIDSIDRDVLPPGYPLAAHSDELGLVREDRGIVLVAGLFTDREAAELWSHQVGEALPPRTIEPLLDDRQARQRVERTYLDSQRESGDMPTSLVVRVDAPGPIPAWPVEAIAELNRSGSGARIDTDAVEPLCHVETGDLFVVNYDEIRSTYYDWAPVRCGDQPAYVTWRATLLHSTAIPQPDGSHRLNQLIGAECDTPFFREWTFTREGRQWEEGEEPDPVSGCGAP
jgi:membrane-bound lytic murein transglycosylase A